MERSFEERGHFAKVTVTFGAISRNVCISCSAHQRHYTGCAMPHEETGADSQVPDLDANAFAVDTAEFQAADSHIEDPELIVDPRAPLAFDRIGTAYCNGAELVYPLPGESLGAEPFLFTMWKAKGSRAIPKLKLTDQAFDEIGKKLSGGFRAFVEGTAPDVARWIAFQFSERIVRQYLSRASLDEVYQSADLARTMLAEPGLPKLEAAIMRLQQKTILREPPEYTPSVGRNFDSSTHLAVSYTLSIYLRGPSYGWGLASQPDRPMYHHLWLRTPAMRDSNLIESSPSEESRQWFPWGSILRRLFDKAKPLMHRNPKAVSEVLTSIREQNPKFRDDLWLALSSGLFRSLRKAKDPRTEAEDLVIKALLNAGAHIRPPGDYEAGLLRILRGAAELGGKPGELAAKEVTAWIPNSWLHRKVDNLETRIRLSFLRDTFWDRISDIGIQDAVKKMDRYYSK